MDSGLAHLIQKLNVKVSKIGSFGDQLDDPSLNPALIYIFLLKRTKINEKRPLWWSSGQSALLLFDDTSLNSALIYNFY